MKIAPNLKFAANLSMLYTELPLQKRFAAAAEDGFSYVEMLWPYEFSKEQVKDLLESNHLKLVLINTCAGDIKAGQWGRGIVYGEERGFLQDIQQALDYASFLGCPNVHVMSGVLKDVPALEQNEIKQQAEQLLTENLHKACSLAEPLGITLTLEALCSQVKPNYFFPNPTASLEYLQRHPELQSCKVQFDVYHCAMTEGRVLDFLEQHLDVIGHIQIASVPQRVEPDEGECDYTEVFSLLSRKNYQGFIGCEYRPRTTTTEGLSWIKPYLHQA